MNRKKITSDTRQLVLHEAGFRCANPVCRTPLTIEIHHLDYVSDGGSNAPDNLIPLCPNCHALHHGGHIPTESLKTWKLVLLTLNEGFDRRTVDILLALDQLEQLSISGDGMLQFAALLSSGLVAVKTRVYGGATIAGTDSFKVVLSEKGKSFVENWKAGNQAGAVAAR